jgi:predicted transposase/invertase (TIGR01784 family)
LDSDLDRWLFILKNMSQLKKISVFLQKPIFQKVFDIATYNNLNKEERMTYDISLKRKWDQYSIKKTAFNEGKDEGKREGIVVGIQKGEINKTREIALKLLNKGVPIDLIRDSTGLSEKEITQMLKD